MTPVKAALIPLLERLSEEEQAFLLVLLMEQDRCMGGYHSCGHLEIFHDDGACQLPDCDCVFHGL